MRVTIIALALFALVGISSADNRHAMCCHSCHDSYNKAHHLKESCMRGCRLYSMIFLAHGKEVKKNEIGGMCQKSCKKGFSSMLGGADARKACNRGCSHQEEVFLKHKADHKVAKMMVLHGLHILPSMHSLVPNHQRIFQQMRLMHQRMMMAMRNAKAVAVQRVSIRVHSMPPGPDGKPRYHVEIHQYPTKINRGPDYVDRHHPHGHHGHHGNHHHHHGIGHVHEYDEVYVKHHNVLHRVRYFFAHMPHGYKLALRFCLSGLLILSLIGLLYLFCSTFRSARPSNNNMNARLSLAKAFKKKPSVQSGDIFYVDVDKKPLIDDDELDKVRRLEDEA